MSDKKIKLDELEESEKLKELIELLPFIKMLKDEEGKRNDQTPPTDSQVTGELED